MNRKAIRVDVDTQHGFCDPRGALFVRGAEKAIPNVARLNRDAVARGIPLIGSVDSHDFSSPEFVTNGGPWPVHCVKGTWDWLKPGATLPERFRIVGRDPTDVVRAFEGGRAALYFEKDVYSIFDNRNVDGLLAALGGPLEVHVYGLATDYCVRAAALEFRKRGHDVVVATDAIAGVAPQTTRSALDEMREAGVRFATTDAVLAAGSGIAA